MLDTVPKRNIQLLRLLGYYYTVGDDTPAPNELADLYDGLFIILEHLPEQTYPPWEFALESIFSR